MKAEEEVQEEVLEEEAAQEEEEAGEEVLEEEEMQEEAEEEAGGDEAADAEEADAAAAAAAAQAEEDEKNKKTTSGADINTASFDELRVDDKGVQAANDCWKLFINTAESREAAGEVIYAALFDSAPSLQSLFVTPRAVQAMKFMNGLAGFVQALEDPAKLKILVETLGFGHLHLDVTVPRVVIFRDAILDVFAVELGERFSSLARDSWTKLLNYVGGAIIFVKANYADRIRILLESWKIATSGEAKADDVEKGMHDMGMDKEKQAGEAQEQKKKGGFLSTFGGGGDKTGAGGGAGDKGAGGGGAAGQGAMSANQVPTTYNEMFKFNSAVMGFGNNAWMGEVLACFDNVVTNVANSGRLQEECDVLVLRISKVVRGNVNFGEYKSCMLASLRSLLPKDWSTNHEVAWSWLWENVERIMQKNMGSPPKWEKALAKIIEGLDENQKFEIRKSIYNRFFALAPAGQDYFKQSNTYLHFIADRVIDMTVEIYRTPVKMVDDVSALGLRHVGYAIPTEFFGPFVTACVEVLQGNTSDSLAIEAFRWSLGLVAKMLVRTIQEGSTIVMKAINSNSTKLLKKAVGCAPRGERSAWLLIVQVGTQSISPLAWSVESGALEAAHSIIQDLLTFRADRDRYYYGMDDLFARHPDIIRTLTTDAPTLVPVLLDGLIWRARTTENGLRRANYYIRHLLCDAEGKFSPTLAWISKTKDPRLVTHPIIVLLSDTVWSRQASRAFMYRKSWFLLTLIVFIFGQSILKHLNEGEATSAERTLVFCFRAFIYTLSMTQLIYIHLSKCAKALRARDTSRVFGLIPLPSYLTRNWQEAAGFLLMTMLVGMLLLEPILWCWSKADGKLFYQDCSGIKEIRFIYSVFSMVAMCLYYALVLDLAVLSTKVSAYVLVCIRMLYEVFLFLLALSATLLAFGSSISVLKHDQEDFKGIHKSILALLESSFKMFDGKHYETYESDPLALACVFLFLIVVLVFLMNMLIAQLTCAYEAVYKDMVGYARLERIDIINGTMPQVSPSRWRSFVDYLKLHEKCEFGAGDIGVTGGVPIQEPANLNPTTQDMIKRFGGSTSVEMQWPAEQEVGDETDKFERLEGLIQKSLKRLSKGDGGGRRKGGGSGTGSGENESHSDEEASASTEEEGGGEGGE
jgi:hemoglobin-like flavoprotein